MDYLCAMDTVYGEANCMTERRVIMGREEEDEDIGSLSSFSGHDDSVSSINSRGSSSSSSSELAEDASSSNSSLSTVNDDHQFDEGPLFEMCDLMSDLPIKRGLSKFFEGKSQSFTSLSNVRSLEDLVKAERPSNKRIKACKSYAGGLNRHKPLSPKHCAKRCSIMKKSSKLGSFGMKRRSFLGLNRPPIPPTMPRSAGISGQTLLFA